MYFAYFAAKSSWQNSSPCNGQYQVATRWYHANACGVLGQLCKLALTTGLERRKPVPITGPERSPSSICDLQLVVGAASESSVLPAVVLHHLE